MKKIYFISLAILFSFTINTISTASSSSKLKVYKINNVSKGDSLFMRAKPNYQAKIIIAIPYNAMWIASRNPAIQRGRSKWQKIYWSGRSGWVNAYYLQYDEVSTKKTQRRRQDRLKNTNTQQAFKFRTKPLSRNSQPVKLQCSGHSPFWNILVNLSTKRLKITLNDSRDPFLAIVAYKKWLPSSNKMIIHAGRGRNAVRATLYKTNKMASQINATPLKSLP